MDKAPPKKINIVDKIGPQKMSFPDMSKSLWFKEIDNSVKAFLRLKTAKTKIPYINNEVKISTLEAILLFTNFATKIGKTDAKSAKSEYIPYLNPYRNIDGLFKISEY
jgi:hypothetical protein